MDTTDDFDDSVYKTLSQRECSLFVVAAVLKLLERQPVLVAICSMERDKFVLCISYSCLSHDYSGREEGRESEKEKERGERREGKREQWRQEIH